MYSEAIYNITVYERWKGTLSKSRVKYRVADVTQHAAL